MSDQPQAFFKYYIGDFEFTAPSTLEELGKMWGRKYTVSLFDMYSRQWVRGEICAIRDYRTYDGSVKVELYTSDDYLDVNVDVSM